jgi:hypothetical protein
VNTLSIKSSAKALSKSRFHLWHDALTLRYYRPEASPRTTPNRIAQCYSRLLGQRRTWPIDRRVVTVVDKITTVLEYGGLEEMSNAFDRVPDRRREVSVERTL